MASPGPSNAVREESTFWAYRLVRAFLSVMVRVFFRQIEVVGRRNVPAQGPVIFCGNHPNSLIDPVTIITTCGRIVHFAAADKLFANRLLRVFLTALGAVPIKRRSDHGGGNVDNDNAFEALHDVLRQGRCMGIFPEGISHDEAQLAKIRTGAARIALGLVAESPGVPLRIVPTGLTFIHRKHFRSRALVQFGPPIVLDEDWCAAHASDERAAVRDLTAEIEAGLRGLTVNAPDWNTLRVLDGVRRLYQPPRIPLAHRVELARRFNMVYEKVRDQPDIAALFARVEAFLNRLSDLGFTDAELDQPLRPGRAIAKAMSTISWALILLPLAAPGFLIHAGVGLLAGFGGHNFTPRKDVLATTKLVIGTMLMMLAYAVISGWVGWQYGWHWGLVTLVALPISGHATIRVLERTASLRRLVMRFFRAFVLRREFEALRRERHELEAAVLEIVERYKPDDMVALYPREARGDGG